ncbi:RtcB family protein, partial [Clostridioides difficile]
MEVQGKYNKAKIFTENVDSITIGQIINLCNQKEFKESSIRIMPDCHAGKGCTIGTTMTISDKVVPNLVGVDIGCGMATIP